MGFEGLISESMFPATAISRHRRSNSFSGKIKKEDLLVNAVYVHPKILPYANPDNIMQSFNPTMTLKQSSTTGTTHTSLKQEILQLEKRLQDQFEERHTLEKALGYRASSNTNANHDSDDKTPKPPATQLIKEIAALETEVVYLEQYLLSLYRKAFISSAVASPSSNSITSHEEYKSPLHTPPPPPHLRAIDRTTTAALHSGRRPLTVVAEEDNCDVIMTKENRMVVDASVQRCHSSLSHSSSSAVAAAFASSNRFSPSNVDDSLGKAVRACQSQPLSMMEYAQKATTSVISLAEYLGALPSGEHVVRDETPNGLSEEMVKCMAVIYTKLSDPPLSHHHHPGLSSPNSSCSSLSPTDIWSPSGFDHPFHVEGLEEFSGPYTTMLEIPWIHRDGNKLRDVEHLLQNYRALIGRLEKVDLRTLSHDEKLAFWINIHNALIMHAFLAYGIPQNSVKRVILLLKAAYNIGGHTINADTIQTTILGCRMSRPGQWLRVLFSPRKKFKAGDSRQGYVVHQPEPLLHFALCLGSHSDPAVRIYTPKRLMEELECAKEEYIRATFSIRKDNKISLPKIVETYAKDMGLCHSIHQLLPPPHSLRNNKCLLAKNIVWIPHNFSFRYLISKHLLLK